MSIKSHGEVVKRSLMCRHDKNVAFFSFSNALFPLLFFMMMMLDIK